MIPVASYAQESKPDDGDLDPLVVQGSKLDAKIPQLAKSVGRVTAERIEKKELRSVPDAFRLLGNVRAPQFVDGGFVIRGINSEAPDAENISGSQAALSTIFMDGVGLTQQAARRGPLGLWDIGSIEVFRGPQSTLQGKNSLAGAVHINTKDPEFNFGGALRLTYGEYGNEEIATMLNLPVTDTFAIRLTYEESAMDSFVSAPRLKSFKRYDDYSRSEYRQFRAKLLYEPNHLPWRSLLTYSYTFSRPTTNDVFGPNADPSIGSFFDRKWLSGSAQQQLRESDSHIIAWNNVFELNDQVKLTSLSTFIQTDLNVGDVSGQNIRDDRQREYSQEIRANWDADWGKAVVGIYGSINKGKSTQNAITTERANAAIFGQIDYAHTDALYLIAGGRLNYDSFEFASILRPSAVSTSDTRFLPKLGIRYEFSEIHTLSFIAQQGYRSGGSGIEIDGSAYTFDPSYTNHFEVAYRNQYFDQKLNLSANAFYTQWKNQQVVVRDLDFNTFQASERVINASDSSLYGAEIELDYQATDTLGFFASVGLLSTKYDDFTFNIDPATAAALGVPSTLDYGGYNFPESPNLTASLGFNYRHDSGFFLTGDVEYSSSYYSPALFAAISSGGGNASIQVPQDRNVKIDGHVTVNMSIGYEAENWKISVFAKNLFGEDYLVGEIPQAVGGGGGITFNNDFLATAAPPRFIGAALKIKF